MVGFLFQTVAKGKRGKQVERDVTSLEQRDWLRNKAKAVRKASFKDHHLESAGHFKRLQTLSENSIGKMYTFQYDAKTKDKLPYWDMFPLIFPIEYYGDSMLGINMHYLPPVLRAQLMDALYTTLNNDKYNKTTKLAISYSILKGASRFGYFKPCIKKYLFSHIRSPFIYIAPDEWDIALMLPTQKFLKASSEKVWQDSRKKI